MAECRRRGGGRCVHVELGEISIEEARILWWNVRVIFFVVVAFAVAYLLGLC